MLQAGRPHLRPEWLTGQWALNGSQAMGHTHHAAHTPARPSGQRDAIGGCARSRLRPRWSGLTASVLADSMLAGPPGAVQQDQLGRDGTVSSGAVGGERPDRAAGAHRHDGPAGERRLYRVPAQALVPAGHAAAVVSAHAAPLFCSSPAVWPLLRSLGKHCSHLSFGCQCHALGPLRAGLEVSSLRGPIGN